MRNGSVAACKSSLTQPEGLSLKQTNCGLQMYRNIKSKRRFNAHPNIETASRYLVEENQSTYDKDAKPISIIITTLAAHAYNNEADLQQALLKVVMEMPRHIQSCSNGAAFIPNPVNPLENFADKWQEYPTRKACFMDWLRQAQLDLTTALKLSDVQSVTESLEPSWVNELSARHNKNSMSEQVVLLLLLLQVYRSN